MSEGNKVKILIALVLLLVIMVILRVTTHEEAPRVALKYKSGQVTVSTNGSTNLTLVQPVFREGAAKRVPAQPTRNIFAPLEFPKPKIKKRPKSKVPTPVRPVKPPVPRGPTPEQLAASKAKQLLAQYRVLGYSNDGGKPRAFLGKGTKIFIVGLGETLEGRVLVAAITDSAVKLRETTTNLETTLSYKKTGN